MQPVQPVQIVATPTVAEKPAPPVARHEKELPPDGLHISAYDYADPGAPPPGSLQVEQPSSHRTDAPVVNPWSPEGFAQAYKEDMSAVTRQWLEQLSSVAGSEAEYRSFMEDANALSARWYKAHMRAANPEASYYDTE